MRSTDRDAVIWGVVSGSPSLLISPRVGSALCLFSLIIAWDTPQLPLLPSA